MQNVLKFSRQITSVRKPNQIRLQLHKGFGPRFHCAIRMPTGLLLRVQFSAKKWRNVSIKFRLSLTDGALPLYFHEIFHCRPFHTLYLKYLVI